MNNNNYVIIMAGGIGSRFWPFSRTKHPKQFQDILGTGQTLIQQTAERFDQICPKENIYVVTNETYYDLVKEQLPFMSDDQILLEPVMRNTAPCIAYASYKIASKNPEANLVIAPADHIITDKAEFVSVVNKVLDHTKDKNILATLGIHPSRPDTGYGYIQLDEENKEGDLNKVKTFTEKPNLEFANKFLESGDYLWNAGIFIWNVQAFIKNFSTHLPDVGAAFEELNDKYYTENETEAMKVAYYQCRNISIDVGLMEKAKDCVYVMPSDFGWSDLGTWKSVYELSEKDEDQNVLQGNIMSYNSKNCMVKTPDDRLVVIQGLENFIVAEHDNVLVICNKDQEQKIKQFVADAKEQKGTTFS